MFHQSICTLQARVSLKYLVRISTIPTHTDDVNTHLTRQEGRDVDPDERTARVKGNERPLPPPLLLHPAWHLTDVV